MSQQVERDEVVFKEPIVAQKDVKARIDFAEPTDWKPKEAVRQLGEVKDAYKAAKLTIIITDDTVRTEHEDAIPKSIIEDQFNVERYPYVQKDKKTKNPTGELGWMGRQKLFDIESAFGFDPCFVDKDNQPVEPKITRAGNKVAPKIEGVARVLNPAFVASYFHPDMTVNPDNWIGKEILIDVEVEKSEQFGDKNSIARYKKQPSV